MVAPTEESDQSSENSFSIESNDLNRSMDSQELEDTKAELQQKIEKEVTTVNKISEDHDDLLGQML